MKPRSAVKASGFSVFKSGPHLSGCWICVASEAIRFEQVGKSTEQLASRICVSLSREREAVKKPLEVCRRRDSGRQDVKVWSERNVVKKSGQVVDVKLLPSEESNGFGRVNVPVSVAVARMDELEAVPVADPARVEVG